MEILLPTCTPTVLIVGNDDVFRQSLTDVVSQLDFDFVTACSLQEATHELARNPADVVIIDSRLAAGAELLHQKEHSCIQKMIVVSNDNPLHSTAKDLLFNADLVQTQVVSLNQLSELLKEWTELPPIQQGNRQGNSANAETIHSCKKVLFPEKRTSPVYQQILRVAPSHATVLLCGETGTGKEVVARTIHDLSTRAQRPFIPINSGAISSSLIESELFGHEAGGFTGVNHRHLGCFEQAQGGTLFFDEITEMPSELQVKLLRVLENGRFRRIGGKTEIQVEVRIIAATNRNVRQAIDQGKLREDLYYRLNVFPIHLPPLRETQDHLKEYAQLFLKEFNTLYKANKSFTLGCLAELSHYSWPGNIRELRNSVHRAFLMFDDKIEHLHECKSPLASTNRPEDKSQKIAFHVGTSLATVERAMIRCTLASFDGDKTRAAKTLGISLKTLYNRLANDRKDPLKLPV